MKPFCSFITRRFSCVSVMNKREGIARELHKQARKNFPTRYVELKGVNDLYQGDLVEMIPFAKVNKGYKYIMTIINCFTKYAIAVPLKTKNANEIVSALTPVFKKHPMKHFQTDQGTEFFNSKVKLLLNKFKINHYCTYSDKKASIVERFNRTLKGRMWRAFSAQGNHRWLHLLKDLIKDYNNSNHRTIRMKPQEVTKFNEKDVLLNIIKNRRNTFVKPKFSVGDKVRISRGQREFTKGYLPRWSNEIFTVWRVQPTRPVTYILKDERGEVIKGGFYQHELSKTKYDSTFLIEKVIRKSGNKLLVRWLGFDKSHDSWVDKKNLVK